MLLTYCLKYYGSRIKFTLKSNFVVLFFPSKFLSYSHLMKLFHCFSNRCCNRCIWWTFEQPRFEGHSSTYVWIFFFSCEKLYCFHWLHGLGDASRVVKKLPAGRASGRSPGIRGMPGGLSKTAKLLRLLGVLEGEAFQEILIQPSLGAKACGVSQVATIFSMRFICSRRKPFSRKLQG